ncbi:MAG: B12-binding domain-containing radical SAM protein [Thermoleophilia bacterium]
MRYLGNVIRPPSEADSLILQVAYGCPNSCSFCSTYLDKPFRVRPFSEVVEDVERLPEVVKTSVRRVFLADGDAMVLPVRRLHDILSVLRAELPQLERVSSYATARSLLRKEVTELAELKAEGLTLLFVGLESGDDATLAECAKGVTVAEQIAGCKRASDAGIALSLTVILGLAGVERSLEHARATGRALSAIDPEFIGALSLMVVEGTAIHERMVRGDFAVPGPLALLRELRELIAAIDVTDALFRSNHASNYLPVGGHLPEDKPRMLATLDAVLDDPGRARLRPEGWRAL